VLKLPHDNGNTLTRSGLEVKNPVDIGRLTAREYGSALGMPSETEDSRQVLCRELTAVAAAGSERPECTEWPRDRVDFIPEGIFGRVRASDRRQRLRVRLPIEPWPCTKYLSVWHFGVAARMGLVTEMYPPYSSSALERVSTALAVGGEAEGGLFSQLFHVEN
jgi:hypothetical protein